MGKGSRLKRIQKIINTLVKHGFGQLIHSMGIDELSRYLPWFVAKKTEQAAELSKAARFRMALEELGPTFIKFGQLLSTRPDIIPRDYVEELSLLQDHVRSFPFERVKETAQKELKHDLDLLFDSFEEEPLAAASISQVHRAVLPGGEQVVVKVQRPDIEKTIEQDLSILKELAGLLDKYTSIGKLYKFSDLVDEFAHVTRMELNYYHEGKNADRLRKVFKDEENIDIPRIYWNYTTGKVLTMEFMDGTTLNKSDLLKEMDFPPRTIAERLGKAYLKQIIMDGFFHGDPHPGNIGVLENQIIYFLDFGITGHLSEEYKQHVTILLRGILEQNTDYLLKAVTRLGAVREEADQHELRMELDRLQEMYLSMPLKELNLGKILHELLEISFKLQIRLPREFALLAKTFLTLEGVMTALEPDFSIAELIEKHRREFLRYQYSPKRLTAGAAKNITKYVRLFEMLPESITGTMERFSKGDVSFKLEIKETDKFLNRLNHMVNRLSFSVVLGSIILGLCLLIQSLEVTILRQYPFAEVALVLAGFMGFWWLWAILRSGRL